MTPPKDVDGYIAMAPAEWQERLRALRATIRAAALGVEERISYGMPSFHYHGRLAYFQLWTKHIGLYGLAAEVRERHREALSGYSMDKGTIRLPLAEPLPLDLVRSLVAAQAQQNETGHSTKRPRRAKAERE